MIKNSPGFLTSSLLYFCGLTFRESRFTAFHKIKKLIFEVKNYCHPNIFCHITFSREPSQGRHGGCEFTVWKKGPATWKHVTSPSHKRTKKISAPCTFKFVWFLEKKMHSYPPWLWKCCVYLCFDTTIVYFFWKAGKQVPLILNRMERREGQEIPFTE